MVTNQSVYDEMCEVYRKFLWGELVEVTRCKDCKHFFRDDMGNIVVYLCELNHEDMRDDFYCADGERRDNER